MFFRSTAAVALICGSLLAISVPAHAQEPAKIAVASIAKIFADMQETKDLTANLQARVKTLQIEDDKRKTDVAALRNTRDNLKPDSPSFSDANDKWLKANIEYEAWKQITQLDLVRQQKQQMKNIYEKVEAATADVAKQNGFDAVFVQQNLDFPAVEDSRISPDQFRASILQHNVLYVGPKADITGQIIAVLDQKYKAGGTASNITLPPVK